MIEISFFKATAPWSCEACTFENSVDLYWCEMCEQGTNPRPSEIALSQKQAREAAMNQQKQGRGGYGKQRGRESGRRGRDNRVRLFDTKKTKSQSQFDLLYSNLK